MSAPGTSAVRCIYSKHRANVGIWQALVNTARECQSSPEAVGAVLGFTPDQQVRLRDGHVAPRIALRTWSVP